MDKYVDSVLELVGAILLIAIAGMVLLQVFARNIMAASLPWASELPRYMFIWLTMVGAWIAARKGLHFRIELFPRRSHVAAGFVVGVVTVVALLLLAYGGTVVLPRVAGTRSPALGWSMRTVYAPITVIALLMAMDALRMTIKLASSRDRAIHS